MKKQFLLLLAATTCLFGCKNKDDNQPHTHSFSEEWSYNEEGHFHKCECGEHDEVVAHEFGEWEVKKEPTNHVVGLAERVCSVCSYVESKDIETLTYSVISIYQDGEFVKDVLTDLDGNYALEVPANTAEEYFKGYFTNSNALFPVSGTIHEDIKVNLVMGAIAYINNEAGLETVCASGTNFAVIQGDITITQPHYVTSNLTLSIDRDVTITRSSDYEGDLFVVGIDSQYHNAVNYGSPVTFNLDPRTFTLTIEGNSEVIYADPENPTVEVAGSAFFVAGLATLNVGSGTVITHHKKIANERVGYYGEDSGTDKPYISNVDKVGGSVVVNIDSTVNFNNVTISHCEVNDSTANEAPITSSYGGAIYNAGITNINGGTYANNKGTYGALMYSSRIVNVTAGVFNDNYSYNYGVIYHADSQYSNATYIAETLGDIHFHDNEAKSSGGALFVAGKAAIVVSKVRFASNIAKNNGGAICSKGIINVSDSVFNANSVNSKGGAIYEYYGDADDQDLARSATIANTTFTANRGPLGSAIGFGNDASAANVSDIVHFPTGTIQNCTFNENAAILSTASKYGHGTIYAQKKAQVKIIDTDFTSNSAVGSGGCFYITDYAQLSFEKKSALRSYASIMTSNSAAKGGAIYIVDNGSVTGSYVKFDSNSSTGAGGAVYAYTNSNMNLTHVHAEDNESATNGGFMYQSGAAVVRLEDITSVENTAATGGFIYITTANSTLEIYSGSSTDCVSTTTENSENIYSNAASVVVRIKTSAFTYNGTLYSGKGAYSEIPAE